MDAGEFGGIGLQIAAEAALLQGEIAKVLFVGGANEDFESDRIATVLREEFGAAHGEESGFQSGNAEETPFGVGHSLHEVTFIGGGWGELLDDQGDEGLLGGDVVGGEENGAAREPGFDGVVGRGEFARCGFGAAGFFGVGTVGGELRGGDGGRGRCGGSGGCRRVSLHLWI